MWSKDYSHPLECSKALNNKLPFVPIHQEHDRCLMFVKTATTYEKAEDICKQHFRSGHFFKSFLFILIACVNTLYQQSILLFHRSTLYNCFVSIRLDVKHYSENIDLNHMFRPKWSGKQK